MANYISLLKLTPEGAKGIKDGPQRLAKSSEVLAKEGFKITAAYAVLGEYDYVFVIEGPENFAKAAKSSAAVSMMGAHSVKTLPAVPLQDFFKVIGEL